MTDRAEMVAFPEPIHDPGEMSNADYAWVARCYERTRADAWEARCRVAVEALQAMADLSTEWATQCVARKTLADIGKLPPPPGAGR